MATRPTAQSPYRQGAGAGGGGVRGDMAVGSDVVARMAREDARWFATAVVALALVLFLALPVTVLVAIDHLENKARTKAEIRKELGELKKLKAEIKELTAKQKESNDKTANTKPADAGGGL